MGVAEAVEYILQGLTFPSRTLRRSVLEETLTDIESVRTTLHPLGFYHFDISRQAGQDFPVRLHIWTGESLALKDQIGNRHDHVWDLTSLVLTGELSDLQLEVEPDPYGDDQLVEISYEPNGERVVPVAGRIRTTQRERRRIGEGSSYGVVPGTFHQTDVSVLPTATLVLARPGAVEGRPRIIATPTIASSESQGTKRILVDTASATQVLSAAVSELGR